MRLKMPLVVAVLTATSLAQGPWVKKDWNHWSKDDCKKILEDSPWARRWTQSTTKVANFATRGRGTEGVGSESELAIDYVVQFRSALPVRQALVRQALIVSRYDSLEPPQQEAMRKQTEGFLNRNYDDVIIVHVTYGSNVQEYNRDLATYWQTRYPEGTVPLDAFLNGPSGQKIAPVRLLSPKGGAQEFELIFPRMVDGMPLLKPGDKTISVEFMSPQLGNVAAPTQGPDQVPPGIASTRVFAEFKVDRMVLNGELLY